MKKALYTIGLAMLTVAIFSCGGSKDESEPVEAVPMEEHNEEDMQQEVFSTVVDDRLQVSMNNVGMTGDTAASMISGYIDARHAEVAANQMQLFIHNSFKMGEKTHEKDYTLMIEEDGRVPGTWVGPNSDCDFMLVAAKDTFRFSTKVGIALYRFKFQFKPKA